MTQFKRPDSPLASRHRELGSALEDWNGVGTAWSYNSNPNLTRPLHKAGAKEK